MSTPILILHNIKPVNGGLTYSVMMRADALASISEKVILFTFGFDENYYNSIQYWKEKLENFKKIEFVNIFEDKNIKGKDLDVLKLLPNEVRIPDTNNPKAYRVFSNGFYKRYEVYSISGVLTSIDHFEAPWTRISKSVYSHNGSRIVEHSMDRKTNKISFSAYYTATGEPLYSCKYDLETNKPNIFFDLRNGREFHDFNDLLASWVDDLSKKYKLPVIFLDKREFVNSCVKIPEVRKVFVLHNPHLASPCDDLSKIDPSMKPIFDNQDLLDKIVVLTKLQKEHLQPLLGKNADKVVVINHPQRPLSNEEVQNKQFYAPVVTSIARYHPQKNLTDAIKAFKIVNTVLPESIYQIYGYGPQEKELKQLIKELSLENNVFLKGFSKNMGEVYRSSNITLLTSRYEGQPLVIGESMAYGVPVISYDITYGPSEIIENGVNGFLVKKYDINALAEKILSVLLNPNLRDKLSENAKLIPEKLSVSTFKEKWTNLLK